MKRFSYRTGMLIAGIVISFGTSASSLVYTPTNPSFGGNPLNGNHMLSNAESQNTHKDPDLEDELSALDDFNDRLQRAILTRVTRSVTSSIVDEEGNLIPGQTETSDFIVTVTPDGAGRLEVVTQDKATGDTTSFWVEATN